MIRVSSIFEESVCFFAHTASFRVNLFSFHHTLTSSYNFAASYSSIVSGIVFFGSLLHSIVPYNAIGVLVFQKYL
ncbi:hypothetical protein BofuT4_uP080220.1 [Botrytis cinerea T4]|uniref:Uncharacterized protein n=1 Tax=Botryotinia fuckeliana (strain T4) TaxID=999810 RepID=G2YKS9_BOTF4|nr:hypothetical protein BofuT4_uP080220.1 [Botrytis cinerea T4]